MLDNSSGSGQGTSIIVANASWLLISYYQAGTGDLKLARCDDFDCTTTSTQIIDASGSVGQHNAIATRWDDSVPFFSYYDAANSDLKLARCNDLSCGNVISFTVDITGDVGQYSSLVVGSDFALSVTTDISYYDVSHHSLKLAICGDTNCGSIALKTLDSSGDVGQYTSLAVDHDFLPAISYYDATNGDLKLAHCADTACNSVVSHTVDSAGDVGRYSSLAIGGDGLPIISYYDATNGDLKVAHCDDVACATATVRSLDTAGDVGRYAALAIGPDQLPAVSYVDVGSGALKLAHCEDMACGSASIAVLDSAAAMAQYTSIGFVRDGLPYVSYYDASQGRLKLAHATGGVKLVWDFGDGSAPAALIGPPGGAPFSHVYPMAGTYTAVVTATNHNGSWNTSTIVTVLPVVDLSLGLAVTPSAAAIGQPVTYTLAYSNGGQLPANGVVVTDSLPLGLTGASFSSTGAVITPTGGVTFSWQVANLAPGAGGVITIFAQAPSQAVTLTNTAFITGSVAEVNELNNVAQAALDVLAPVADLRLTQHVTPNIFVPGQPVTFSLAYTNTGPQSAMGVVITDLVPASLVQLSYSTSGAIITATGNVSFTWQVQDLSPGMSGVIRVVGLIEPALAGVAVLTNSVVITGTSLDPAPGNNASGAVAVFGYPLSVTLAGTGSGTVNSSPPGVACGVDCLEIYPYGTAVTLNATPALGSSFAGWSGICSGSALCMTTIHSAQAATGTFNRNNLHLYLPLTRR